jgi:predicted flavoprotein YhiN
MAALAAAEQGRHVLLLEPGAHIGRMVTGGLTNSDVEGQQKI